jgi:hypothetical protein
MKQDHIPLAPLQEAMWNAELGTDSARENVFGLLEFDGEFGDSQLRAAVADVFWRQEALRIEISSGPPPMQRVADTVPELSIEQVDSVTDCVLIAETMASTRIPLTGDVLWRARLLGVGSRRFLAYTFHHIVVDGWSLNVFADDICAAIAARAGAGDPLPALSPEWTHTALIRRQLEYRSDPSWEKTLTYWTEQLPNPLRLLDMPGTFERPDVQSGAGSSVAMSISADQWSALLATGRQARATPFAVLSALTARALAVLAKSGAAPLIFGVPFHNRLQRGSHRTISYVSNMVPLIVDPAVGMPLADALRNGQRAITGAFANAQVPPEYVMEHVYGSTDLPYRFCLNMKGTSTSQGVVRAVRCRQIPVGNDAANFDYELFVAPSAEGGRASLCWDTDIYTADDAALLQAEIERELADLLV